MIEHTAEERTEFASARQIGGLRPQWNRWRHDRRHRDPTRGDPHNAQACHSTIDGHVVAFMLRTFLRRVSSQRALNALVSEVKQRVATTFTSFQGP
jgi:hypothetical protein